ncbi:pentapeptide repeat-containing protein [Sphaerisporangium viridialbum]
MRIKLTGADLTGADLSSATLTGVLALPPGRGGAAPGG